MQKPLILIQLAVSKPECEALGAWRLVQLAVQGSLLAVQGSPLAPPKPERWQSLAANFLYN